jgi:uncharacterized protein (DUF934 family)
MPLVKHGRVVEDPYLRVVDDAPVPDGTAVIVPAARFLADAAELARRSTPTGLIWPNDRKVAELAPWLDRLALIALTFPNFRDGRAYTQARQLRERYGFRGELRATGEILRDQFLFLTRAGFDSLEVKKAADATAYAEAVGRYGVFYQSSANGVAPAQRRRLSRLVAGGESIAAAAALAR